MLNYLNYNDAVKYCYFVMSLKLSHLYSYFIVVVFNVFCFPTYHHRAVILQWLWQQGAIYLSMCNTCYRRSKKELLRPYGIYFEFQIRIFQGTFIFEGVSEMSTKASLASGTDSMSSKDNLGWWTCFVSTKENSCSRATILETPSKIKVP